MQNQRRKLRNDNLIFLVGLLTGLILLIFAAVLILFSSAEEGEAQQERQRPDGSYILYNGKEYRYDEDNLNLLFIGIDKYQAMEEQTASGRLGMADAIVLVSLNSVQKTMRIVAIPRETITLVTIVDSEGKEAGKEEMVLTFQYAYGTSPEQSGELTMDAVSELLYGVPIKKYCAVNFEAIPILNDAVGGVEVEVLEDLTFLHPELAEGGTVRLDGQMAFDYIHYRDISVTGSSISRMDRQKQYIAGYLQEMKTLANESMASLMELYEELGENMNTNITTEDMVSLMSDFKELSLEQTEMIRVPGEIQTGEAYDVTYDVYIADQEELKQLVIDLYYEEAKEAEHE